MTWKREGGTVRGPPVRLVYVLGTGRCGSTVLDILLGSHPQIQSTGELDHISHVYESHPQTCSCGAVPTACPFWGQVLARLPDEASLTELEAGWRRYEQLRSIPLVALRPRGGMSALRRHARRLAALAGAIARISGKGTVVDSSKNPARGLVYALAEPSELDVRFVHLVRDGRGYIWSKLAQSDGEGVPRPHRSRVTGAFILRWITENLVSSVIGFARGGRYLRIRYEDLTSDPVRVLGQLGEFLGTDLGPVAQAIARHQPVPVSHIVGGNRLRFSTTITLRADVGWKLNLPSRYRLAFWSFAGWLARLYGYRYRA